MELQSGLVRVASYRRKLPRKAKNIYLPTEVWVDVFCFPWTTRKKMAQIVDKIGNRWFGEQLQFYLHKWGKHTLRPLYFKAQGVGKHQNGQFQQLEYPQTAMPENIKFCKTFEIGHFDNHVFNFFRRIQSLLKADTNLAIGYPNIKEQEGNARTILGHLLPFIDGIHTVSTNDRMLPTIARSIPPEKFHKVKVLDVALYDFMQSTMQSTMQSAMPCIMEWLTTSSNEQKLLKLCCFEHGRFGDGIDQQVLKIIRKQFTEATEPSTFAVLFSDNDGLLNFHCENANGELLSGTRKENSHGRFIVLRHQANNAEADEQLRQWVGYMCKKGLHDRKQCISLREPTIGQGNIFAMPDLDEEEARNDEEEDKDEKPSTSKKRRTCK